MKTLSIEPGSPGEDGSVERFNGTLRDELLAREVFDTLLEAKVLIERWRKASNPVRPHSSPGHRPPAPESRVARRAAGDRHQQPLTAFHATVWTALKKSGFKTGLRRRDKSGLERG